MRVIIPSGRAYELLKQIHLEFYYLTTIKKRENIRKTDTCLLLQKMWWLKKRFACNYISITGIITAALLIYWQHIIVSDKEKYCVGLKYIALKLIKVACYQFKVRLDVIYVETKVIIVFKILEENFSQTVRNSKSK